MKIEYSGHQSLQVGVPYTYGTGVDWYVRLPDNSVLYLNEYVLLDASDCVWHIANAHRQRKFCYAKSMEIL